MRQIKIVETNHLDWDDFDIWAARGITDWEEVDDETFRKLQGWIIMKNREAYDFRYALIVKAKVDIPTCVAEYVKYMEEEEQRKAQEKAKAEQARKLKLLKKQKLAEDEERKLFEQLKSKFGDSVDK